MSSHTFDAERVYTGAADGYAELSERMWSWAAAGVATRLRGLPAEANILDAGCGPGGVTVRTARLLGDRAHVTGIDVTEGMLLHARAQARAWGTRNTAFVRADMNALDDADLAPTYTAVSAGLSLFLAPDITATAAGLWQRVAPGGRLVVSVVSEQFFSPAFDHLLDVLAQAGHDDLDVPWQRVDHPETLRAALTAAGIDSLSVDAEIRQVALETPADWLQIINGTGIRALLDDLADEVRSEVVAASRRWLEARRIRTLAFGVLFATADKPR